MRREPLSASECHLSIVADGCAFVGPDPMTFPSPDLLCLGAVAA